MKNFSVASVQFNATVSAAVVIQQQDATLYDAVSIIVVGALVATILAEVSNDNAVSWSAVSIVDRTSTTPQTRIAAATGITAPGVYSVPLPYGLFRVRCSAYTSGTPTINLYYSPEAVAI